MARGDGNRRNIRGRTAMAASERRVDIAGSERPLTAGATLLGAVDPASTVQFTFVVRPRPGSEPLPGFEYWQRTPLAGRRYPSVAEFAAKHGAAQEDLDAVAAFARSHGLQVLEANAARRNVVVSGTASQVNAAPRKKMPTLIFVKASAAPMSAMITAKRPKWPLVQATAPSQAPKATSNESRPPGWIGSCTIHHR